MGKKKGKKKSKKGGNSGRRSGTGVLHNKQSSPAAEGDIDKKCEMRIAEINAVEMKMAGKQLRFAIGDRVECAIHVQSDEDIMENFDFDSWNFAQMLAQLAMGEGPFAMTYKTGTVVDLWDHNHRNKDVIYPYLVRLDEDNLLICAKEDEDSCIRKSDVSNPRDTFLFKQPPPREDCPICFLPLPLQLTQQTKYFSCCGKVICLGCIVAAQVAGANDMCPFCRATTKISSTESTRRIEEGIKRGDPEAMVIASLALCKNGNKEEKRRGSELMQKAANDLGLCSANYRLGCAYTVGDGTFGVVEQDSDKAMFHFEEAAIAGHGGARFNIGVKYCNDASTRGLGAKHLMIGAKSGYQDCMDLIKKGFVEGWVTKAEFEETLRANEESLAELKSVQRDKATVFFPVYNVPKTLCML